MSWEVSLTIEGILLIWINVYKNHTKNWHLIYKFRDFTLDQGTFMLNENSCQWTRPSVGVYNLPIEVPLIAWNRTLVTTMNLDLKGNSHLVFSTGCTESEPAVGSRRSHSPLLWYSAAGRESPLKDPQRPLGSDRRVPRHRQTPVGPPEPRWGLTLYKN